MATATSTPNIIVGKSVAVVAGGKLAYCIDGTSTRQVAVVKVTNSRSNGYQQVKAGVKSSNISLNLVYNGDDPPTGIEEGKEVILVIDTLGNSTEQGLANPDSTPHGRFIQVLVLIVTVTDKWSAEQDYTWSIEGQSTGEYTVNEYSTDSVSTNNETTTVTVPTAPAQG